MGAERHCWGVRGVARQRGASLTALAVWMVAGLSVLAGCTFPANTHVMRHADSLTVDGVDQKARVIAHSDYEAGFTLDGTDLVVTATGRQLVSVKVKLGYVLPVKEQISDGQGREGRLAVAVQVTAPPDRAFALHVDGQVRDEQGRLHQPTLVGIVVEGWCGAYAPTDHIRRLDQPLFQVSAGARACLYLGYDIEPRIVEPLKVMLGTALAGPGVPEHRLALALGSLLTQQFNGH